MFYLNCAKFPSYQSYNNLGLYLYENGLNLKNGTVRSASKIGEHYIRRALGLERHQTVLNNLGRIAYERGEYLAAYQFYSQSYELVQHDAIAYNLALSLFCLHRYSEAYSILKECKDKLDEALLPYLFATVYTNRAEMEDLSAEVSEKIETLDGVDQLLLFYMCKRYDKVVLAAEIILSNWWLDQEQWAVLIDSFIQTNEIEKLKTIIADYADHENRSLCRKIRILTQDAAVRKNSVARCYEELAFPIIVLSGYCED